MKGVSNGNNLNSEISSNKFTKEKIARKIALKN